MPTTPDPDHPDIARLTEEELRERRDGLRRFAEPSVVDDWPVDDDDEREEVPDG